MLFRGWVISKFRLKVWKGIGSYVLEFSNAFKVIRTIGYCEGKQKSFSNLMPSSATYHDAYTYLILNIMRSNDLCLNALEINYS